MAYKISKGITEAELEPWIRNAYEKYGLYKNTKAVDYTHADKAPVVMCTLLFKDQILLVKRAYGLADADGYWSTVNGFIDEIKPVKEFVLQESSEELGLELNPQSITVGQSMTLKNDEEKRSYIVFPCLVKLETKPSIKLNEENTDYKWIKREELKSYHILEDLPLIIDKALALG